MTGRGLNVQDSHVCTGGRLHYNTHITAADQANSYNGPPRPQMNSRRLGWGLAPKVAGPAGRSPPLQEVYECGAR